MAGRRVQQITAWGCVALFTAGLYALAPFGPDIQKAIVAHLGSNAYVLIPLPFALVAAFFLAQTVRRRPDQILGTLVAFGVFGVVYASCLRLLGQPVEQVHFLLYGALSGIVFWALSGHQTGWILYPWALLVVYLIGMGDELIQWWLPNRVADFHDVLFDALGGALGLAFLGVSLRPRAARGHLHRHQVQRLAAGIIVGALATGAFVTSIHEFGFAIRDPELGTFLSLFRADEFVALNGARLAAATEEASRDPRLHRFDVEARRHIRFQERHLQDGRLEEAASERAIVHRYYAAYLAVSDRLPEPSLPLDASPMPAATFQSEAYQGKIFTVIGRRAVWLAVAGVVIAAVCATIASARAFPGDINRPR